MAGKRTNKRRVPRESLSGAAAANAGGAARIAAPIPIPIAIALALLILSSWFNPGRRMLKSTQPIAGTKVRRRAKPRLSSPS